MDSQTNSARGNHFYRALFISTFVISAFTVGGGFVLCTLVAWGMWFFVERPTDIWRKQLRAS